MNGKSIDTIAQRLLQFQNNIKVYHWHTMSYARHKASDSLFATFLELNDKFVETLQGVRNERVNVQNAPLNVTALDDNSIVAYLQRFAAWLTDQLPRYLQPADTDLMNIRDEMLGAVNQTLYLFTFT
jgi:hypothetical protein